jgi:type III restriction enzyme
MKLSTKLSVDQFSADQLVLEVSESVDPKRLDLSGYEDFIEEATRGRDFQREAIETTVRFLCGGEYGSAKDLARQAFAASPDLQRRYPSAARLIERLPFADRLACSLDMATGTGKSFVYHAIARIMLNEGHVDRVLVLCPSLTIEQGLTEKFRALVADGDLGELLPERGGVRVPDIVDAMSTVKEGQVCVENIHAT